MPYFGSHWNNYRSRPKLANVKEKRRLPKLRKKKMNLYQKILKVQEAVGTVPKTGYNSFQKYHYVTEADLLDAVRTHMVANGLTLLMLGIQEETGMFEGKRWAKVKVNFRLVDTDKPEDFINTDSVGYAEDNGDKAIYKAITGASKYLYYKLFMVSTGDDPERDEAPKPQSAKKPAAAQPPAPEHNKKAMDLAMLISEACKRTDLTPAQVASITEIPSIREAAARGDVAALTQAWNKVQAYLQKKGAA
jgi:hypothetical protein